MGSNIIEETARKKEQRQFHRNAQRLLTEDDRNYLHSIIKEFNVYRSVDKLILSLKSCLDTPEKLDLLKDIRMLIPPQHLTRFDSLAPYNKMAHPFKDLEITDPSNNNEMKNSFLVNGNDTSSLDSKSSFRIVSLNKAEAAPSGTMGFSIRGGKEANMGVFVSKVEDDSLAQRQGLLEGDQIIEVNGVSFEHIANSSAVNFLSSLDKIKFVVKSTSKRFSDDKPSTLMDNSITTWVDKNGKPLIDGDNGSGSTQNGLTLRHDQWHLSDADERRVNFTVEFTPSGFIGFNIRGGAEYGLGIYVSGVDIGSVVEEAGIQIGDQILDVNGRSFEAIRHQDAVDYIRAQKHIMMTVKAVGKLPEAKHYFSEMSWIHPDGSITRESKYHGSQVISPPASPRLDMSDSSVQFPDTLNSSTASVQTGDPFIRSPSIDNATQTIEEAPEPPIEIMVSPMTSTPNPSPAKEPDIEMMVMTADTVDAKPELPEIHVDSKGYDTKSVESRTSSASSGAEKKDTSAKRSSLDSMGDPEYSEVIPRNQDDRPGGTKKKRSKSFLSKQGDKIRAKLSFRKKAKPKVEDRRGPDDMRAYVANKAKQTLSVDEFNAFLRVIGNYQSDGNVDGMTKRLLEILDQPNKAILLRDIRALVHPHDLGRFDTLVKDREIEIIQWLSATNPSASSLLEGTAGKPQRKRIEPVLDSRGNFSLRTESEAASYKKEREKYVKQKGQIFSQTSTLLDREHRRESTVALPPGFSQITLPPVQTVAPLSSSSQGLDTVPVRDSGPTISVTEPVAPAPAPDIVVVKPKPPTPSPYQPPAKTPTLSLPSIQLNDSPDIVVEEPVQRISEEPPQASLGSFLAVPDRVAAEYKDEEDPSSAIELTPMSSTGITAMESSGPIGDPFAPQMLTVNLSKQRTSMGISISGGKGSRSQPEIRVEKVFPGGAAYDNGMLQSGYEIVSIDGLSLRDVSHAEAVDIIRKAYNDKSKAVMEIVVIP